MMNTRSPHKWARRQPASALAGLLALICVCWVPRPADSTPAATPAPPASLLHDWQPLVPRPRASKQRSELRPLSAAHGKKLWARVCKASERLRARLMSRAARLFYSPVRQGADTGAIERFLYRYVRGAQPLLITAGEVFAPAPALRDLGVHACVRAGKPAMAERFVARAAVAGTETRLRVALAIIRLQKGQRAIDQLWLVGSKGGGARAALVRALATGGETRNGHLGAAQRAATAQERLLIAAFQRWLGAGG